MSTLTVRELSTAVLDEPSSDGGCEWKAFQGPLDQSLKQPAEKLPGDDFNPGDLFERWFDEVQAGPKKLSCETGDSNENEDSQFFYGVVSGLKLRSDH